MDVDTREILKIMPSIRVIAVSIDNNNLIIYLEDVRKYEVI